MVKDAVQDYMKMEVEEAARAAFEKERVTQLQLEDQASKLAIAERDKAALSSQLKNLRDAKSYLYAFHLFDNRYNLFPQWGKFAVLSSLRSPEEKRTQ